MDLTTGMPPPPPPAPTGHSEAWLAAIADGETRTRVGDASGAIDRLLRLKDALQSIGRDGWDEPPAFPPPSPAWDPQQHQQHQQQRADLYDNRGTGIDLDPYAFQSPQAGSAPVAPPPNNRNAFAAFEEDDSEDDSGDDEVVMDVKHERGDAPNERTKANGNGASTMSVRRILLRTYCSLAEVHSRRALDCCSDRRWTAGADDCEAAFFTVRLGQEMLDEECASLAQVVELIEAPKSPDVCAPKDVARLRREVETRQGRVDEDSGVVSVMMSHFVRSRDRYLHAGHERIAFLEDKLCRDDETRQEIRSRMGSRWRSNPSPSNTYAERRKAMERELDEALAGVNRTSGMNVDGIGGR